MGVHQLWKVLDGTQRAVRLESLSRKKMAVDASIWIYQFLKAVRDKSGSRLGRSHIVGFFRRVCKLLFFGIQPVFVFDGGAPLLKRETVRRRKERRLGKREGAENTARRLLALQLQRKQQAVDESFKKTNDNGEEEEELHYLEDFDKTAEQLEEEKRNNFRSTDEYHLPQIEGFKHSKNDTRIIGEEDKDELARIAQQVDELDGIDLNTVDPGSTEFSALPLSTQYMVLSQLRLRSRLRMGYSKEQLESIFPDSRDFSKFQIQMVQKRNYFTQRLMNISGMDTSSKTEEERMDNIRRIAGERGKTYRIQKNEGGWSLSLNDEGESAERAIDLEKEKKEKKPFEDEDSEDEGIEWEEVPLEPVKTKVNYSISALPLPPAAHVLGEDSVASTVKSFSFSPAKSKAKKAIEDDEVEDDENEALRQIEEIELIEAIQKSKAELRKQQELEQKMIQESIEQSNKKVVTYEDQAQEPEFDFDHDDPFGLQDNSSQPSYVIPPEQPAPSTAASPKLQNMKLRSEMDHLLNLNSSILSKKPQIQQPSTPAITPSMPEESEKREQPSWFSGNVDDAYSRKGTTVSHESREAKNKVDEFVPFYEVREMAEAARQREQQDIHNDEDDVVEVEPHEALGVAAPNDEQQLISDEKDDQQPVSDKDEQQLVSDGKDEQEEQAGVEKDITAAPPIDYEFYESDEERLQDQLDKEEQEHEQFQKDLNPHVINTLSIDDLDETRLRDQRKKELRDSDEVTQDMVKDVQELLACFGIPYITAPMEAEAQCAELLRLGLVDGIITDDSDVFLFGGDRVYKNMFHEKGYVEFYNGNDIEKNLGLDRAKLIALAHLLGSDYTEGLKGIGPVNAVEILAHFGGLKEFKNWLDEGQFDVSKQEKEGSFEKGLRRKLVKNEVLLDKGFPDSRVSQAYLQPEVDHDKTPFVWGSPDLDRLRTYLMSTVGWGQDRVDQVLVPLIQDLNRKKRSGVQSTLGEFYSIEDLNYYNEKSGGAKKTVNKRMANARNKMTKRQRRT